MFFRAVDKSGRSEVFFLVFFEIDFPKFVFISNPEEIVEVDDEFPDLPGKLGFVFLLHGFFLLPIRQGDVSRLGLFTLQVFLP